jgi:hypothetical protein
MGIFTVPGVETVNIFTVPSAGGGGGGGGGGAPNTVTRTYTPGVLLRDPVYQKADGTVDRGDATSIATMPLVGVVSAIDSPSVGECEITYAGDLGGFAGLTAGKLYIMGITPGVIVADDDTANVDYPDNAGNIVHEVGVASSATNLYVGTNRDFTEN